MSRKLFLLLTFVLSMLLVGNALAATRVISGTVKDAGGVGLPGVLMTPSSGPAAVTTDSAGAYSFTVTTPYTGTITPSRTGCTFTPGSKSYNAITTAQSAQDYTANTYTIKGTLLNGNATLTVTVTPSTGTAVNVATGSLYTITVPSGWTGTITPSAAGYTFTPASRSITTAVSANQTGQDFTTILTLSGSTTVGDVTMNMTYQTPTGSTSFITSGGGSYSATVLDGYSNVVITPSKAGYTFSPASTSFPAPHLNKTANFTPKVIISGTIDTLDGVTMGGMPGNPVTVGGLYSATVDYNWSGVVTPAKTGYDFNPASKTYSSVIAPLTGEDYTPSVGAVKAFDPRPINGTKYNRIPVQLGWTLGDSVVSQDIYIGTNFDDVDNATESSELCVQNDYVGSSYVPTLAYETTYYWRIDGNYSASTLKGDVWNFKTGKNEVIDPNLIGWWDFDDQGDTVAWDRTGKGHNGTMSNTTYVGGKSGNALNFAKANLSYVDIPVAAVSTLDNQVTIALWTFGADTQPIQSAIFNATAGTGTNRVFNAHIPWITGSTASVIIDIGNSGSSYDRVSGIAVAQSAPGDHAINEYKGKWNHWAITKNSTGAGEMKVYCNGILMKSGSGLTKLMSGIGKFKIGANSDGITNNYDGMIDDFRVYDKAMTALEVEALAAAGGAYNFSPANNAVVQSSVLLDWDSATVNPLYDVYVSSDIQKINSLDITARAAHDISQSNFQADNLALDTTFYWTVDVNENSTMHMANRIMSFRTANTCASNPLPVNGAKYIIPNQLSWTPSGIMISQDVYFGTDSALVTARDASVLVANDTTASNYALGALTSGVTYYWLVDTTSSEGTNSQGAWSFTATAITDANFIGSWQFEDIGNSKALDSSGYNHDGTFAGAAAIVTDPCGVRGNVLYLDGAGDYINLGNGAWTNPGNHMTISAWIMVDIFDVSFQTIIAKGTETYRLGRASNTNKLQTYMNHSPGSGSSSYKYAGSTSSVNIGWHHVVASYDGATMKIYIDGKQEGSNILSTLNANTDSLMIGRNSAETGRDWQGWIDDVRMYNKAMNAFQVAVLAGKGPDHNAGDFDGDGKVRFEDVISMAALLNNHGQKVNNQQTIPGDSQYYNVKADINGDGMIRFNDLVTVVGWINQHGTMVARKLTIMCPHNYGL